ncbi:MAG: aminodeoxychorismate/anthranilate synthase component II [Candidatus Eremiobacteraeota bacterium]|nr:aminodeoxychorismate/anthranilate synthase component II [Candidatus Eremiobacteraeota bacterium]
MTSVLIADNYDSFTYNLAQAFGALGACVTVVRSDELDCERVSAGPPDAIVVSPGPGRPGSAGVSLQLVRALSGRVPVLGVCLGHQVIGEAFGARVVPAPAIVHGKTSAISHRGGPLFAGVPMTFAATRYHSLVVEETSIAKTPLQVIARDEHGMLMAMQHRQHPTFGVQFHPESILTSHGPRVLANFLRMRRATS